ncbi:MAG: hypothetical protein R3190_11155, partial [Thermoanaerobaculia bacterium]|nr:hypothetical protein [Thermoanaerobaculia bacterium]
MSTRLGGTFLGEHLASHGYVVVAPDFPLTHAGAPGGPNEQDVVNQPADVSFLIDRALAAGTEPPFDGAIDRERIGVLGLSLGGATTTLVAFHPEWRDPRIAAAISLAGVGDVFGAAFYDHAAVPYLMIAGTADGILDYGAHAAPVPDRIRDGGLLTLAGGTHLGFDQIAAGPMRILGNPDRAACLLASLGPEPDPESPFNGLFGSTEQGLIEVTEYALPCSRSYPDTMAAGRQQMLTAIAVRAFFESRFARTRSERTAHESFLRRTLPAEIPEATFTSSRR